MARAPPKGMPVVVQPMPKMAGRDLGHWTSWVQQCDAISKAVGYTSSRTLTASAISLMSHNQPVERPIPPWHQSPNCGFLAASGTAMASVGNISEIQIPVVSLMGRIGATHFHFDQLRFIRYPDAIFKPVMDIWLGKSPLSSHLSTR